MSSVSIVDLVDDDYSTLVLAPLCSMFPLPFAFPVSIMIHPTIIPIDENPTNKIRTGILIAHSLEGKRD